jgi:hypothetical protein
VVVNFHLDLELAVADVESGVPGHGFRVCESDCRAFTEGEL